MNFFEEANSPEKMACLNNFFQGAENKALRLVKDSNGEFCVTPEASIHLLMDAHFPGSVGHMIEPRAAHTLVETESFDVEFISPDLVRKAFWSFGNLKAVEPDELKLIVLKHVEDEAVNKLVKVF